MLLEDGRVLDLRHEGEGFDPYLVVELILAVHHRTRVFGRGLGSSPGGPGFPVAPGVAVGPLGTPTIRTTFVRMPFLILLGGLLAGLGGLGPAAASLGGRRIGGLLWTSRVGG